MPLQAVEARTTEVCGIDMSAINRYRWTPAFAAGVPLKNANHRGRIDSFALLCAMPSAALT